MADKLDGGFLRDPVTGALVVAGPNGSTIGPRGITLGQTVVTSDATSLSNTSYADVSGVSVTFTPRTVPFTVDFWCRQFLGAGTFAAGGRLYLNGRLVNSDASVDYTGDFGYVCLGNLDFSQPILERRYFDVGDFTPNTAMTVKLQSKMFASSVTSGVYAISARMGIRAVEDM